VQIGAREAFQFQTLVEFSTSFEIVVVDSNQHWADNKPV
jgi:hypothetical protein